MKHILGISYYRLISVNNMLGLIYNTLLLGCGQEERNDRILKIREVAVANEVSEYVSEFENTCEVANRVDIYIRDIPSPLTLGRCTWSKEFNYIEIAPYVLNLDPVLIRTIVFHELGHCVLNKQHVTVDDIKIMSAKLNISSKLTVKYIDDNWDRLTGELCKW